MALQERKSAEAGGSGGGPTASAYDIAIGGRRYRTRKVPRLSVQLHNTRRNNLVQTHTGRCPISSRQLVYARSGTHQCGVSSNAMRGLNAVCCSLTGSQPERRPKPAAQVSGVRGRFRRAIATVSAAALVLAGATGCIGYEEHVTFAPSGSGTFQLKFGFDVTLFNAFGDTSEIRERTSIEREPIVEQFGEDSEVETLSEEVDGRQYEGFRMKVSFPSPSEFSELTNAIAERTAENDPETGRLAATLHLDVTGDTYTLTGDLPPLFGEQDKDDPFARLMLGTARRVFIMTLPGQVTSSNANSRDGQTYTWKVDPLSSASRAIYASWNAYGPPTASVDPVSPARARAANGTPTRPVAVLRTATPAAIASPTLLPTLTPTPRP